MQKVVYDRSRRESTGFNLLCGICLLSGNLIAGHNRYRGCGAVKNTHVRNLLELLEGLPEPNHVQGLYNGSVQLAGSQTINEMDMPGNYSEVRDPYQTVKLYSP